MTSLELSSMRGAPASHHGNDPVLQRRGGALPTLYGAIYTVLILVLLAPVLSGGLFADDWEFLTNEPRRHILGAFFEPHPYTLTRPIEWSLFALFQTIFGPTTVPMHLANVAIHVGLAALTVRVLQVFGATAWGTFLGGLLVALSQVGAVSVAGNDTLSNTLSALAGCMALWWMLPSPHREFRQRWIAAMVAFAVALFAKESSMGYLPVLCVLAARGEGEPRHGANVGTRVARAGAFVAIALLYMAWRQNVGAVAPNFGHGGHFGLGRGLILHPLMLGYAALVPVSTTHIFLGVHAHHWLWPALGVAGVMAVSAIAAWGAWKLGRSKWKWAQGWVLAGTATVGPIILLRHVSQTESYALVPFAAVMFGFGAGDLLERFKEPGARAILALALVAIFGSHAFASRYAAQAMDRNGRIAGAAMTRLLGFMQGMPPGGTLVLVEPRLEVPNYSVIQMRGFVLVPDDELRRISKRTDVTVRAQAPGEPVPPPRAGQVVVTMDRDGEVVRLP